MNLLWTVIYIVYIFGGELGGYMVVHGLVTHVDDWVPFVHMAFIYLVTWLSTLLRRHVGTLY